MQCLIVAAGQGTRLRGIASLKPLAEVWGVPLIVRIMESALAGGGSEFVVVTGYEGDRLEAFLATFAAERGVKITCVRNHQWMGSNGLSVVAARPVLQDRFILLMSDHLFDPTIMADLISHGANSMGVTLAVDRRLDNPLVDLEDVTRVRTDPDGRIVSIGKLIEPYDVFDTGIFLASPELPIAIESADAAGEGAGISSGMQRLAAQGLASTFDIGDRFWLDVDDPTAYGHAVRETAQLVRT